MSTQLAGSSEGWPPTKGLRVQPACHWNSTRGMPSPEGCMKGEFKSCDNATGAWETHRIDKRQSVQRAIQVTEASNGKEKPEKSARRPSPTASPCVCATCNYVRMFLANHKIKAPAKKISSE
ncbi:hypothetical protein DPMN_162617 [Dreissena polymorpha]|uniref:Uncharacterized protein n=1 Tax=Dreissena polymorpha TaxID=45954 RepID=A0A9D4ITS0_DREPO|nr:hypothetical protein DPMN_162617 [Dreissena polymorpha]